MVSHAFGCLLGDCSWRMKKGGLLFVTNVFLIWVIFCSFLHDLVVCG